jgi:hypothetical protein
MRTLALLGLLALVGCGPAIAPRHVGPLSGTDDALPPMTPTWTHDVQPLVAARCQGCHVEGGIAPFALTTYDDAMNHRGGIVAAVSSGQMPPWMPSEACLPVAHSRRLTPGEVGTFLAWSQAGGPLGTPATPGFPKTSALQWVDSTLSASEPYLPNASLTDDYRCLPLSHGLTADRDVVGIDVQPDQRRMVHHVILYAIDAADAKSLDDADPGVGWPCFGGPGGGSPKMIGGWVPGTEATAYPADTGIPLEASKVLVMQIHYNLSAGAPLPDRTRLLIQYSKERVPKPATIAALANFWFSVPPHAIGEVAQASYKLPAPVTLWGVIPHMHTHGRTLSVDLDGECLINIPKWDFHWQQPYFFEKPLGVEANQTVRLVCTFDNPTDAALRWGEKTTDEMCLNYFYITSS